MTDDRRRTSRSCSGPMLRYVDETSATVWVRTADAARVTVERAGRSWSAPTFAVHGSHYALVVLDGLQPGSDDAYAVRVDDVPVWPRAGMPPSRIRTLRPERACRTSPSAPAARRAPTTTRGNNAHGVDALRSLAAGPARRPRGARGPTCCCCSATRSTPTPPRTRSSRSSWPPGAASTSRPAPEIKDFVEYAELYRLAWSDDVIRWVLSTRALGDDLRRPRHPRRLEHLVVLAPRDPHDDVVAGAHRLRPRRRTGCTSTSATSRRPSWRRRRCGASWPRTRPPGPPTSST